jgi:hypothetical protein
MAIADEEIFIGRWFGLLKPIAANEKLSPQLTLRPSRTRNLRQTAPRRDLLSNIASQSRHVSVQQALVQ